MVSLCLQFRGAEGAAFVKTGEGDPLVIVSAVF